MFADYGNYGVLVIICREISGFAGSTDSPMGNGIHDFLAKNPKVKTWKDLRGISLLACLQKWYHASVLSLVSTIPVPRPWKPVSCVAYLPGISATELITGLQLLFSRGWEWSDRSPVFVTQADVLSAFDYMTPQAG